MWGEHAPWDAAVPRGLFIKFRKSSRSSVVPDHHKGITGVKQIIKTSEGPAFCFLVSQKSRYRKAKVPFTDY